MPSGNLCEFLFRLLHFLSSPSHQGYHASDPRHAAGTNALGQNEHLVYARRCAWHTFLRVYFWTGGFFTLFLIQGNPLTYAAKQLLID